MRHACPVTFRPLVAATVLPLAIFAAACARTSRYPLSDHHDGHRFFNPGMPMEKGFGDFIKWQWNRERHPWPELAQNTGRSDLLKANEVSSLAVTWVGHATMLVQLGRANVLTDPIFSERASPVSFAGPKRIRPPGLAYDELPPIHVVVVSHNHYDHLDLPTLRELDRRFRPLFVVPLGNKSLLEGEDSQGLRARLVGVGPCRRGGSDGEPRAKRALVGAGARGPLRGALGQLLSSSRRRAYGVFRWRYGV